jgi:transcriptional/translational regulatory protein YebC/TACO1
MARQFISRRDAVACLFRILANCNLDETEQRNVKDIIHCIEAELENYHEWGADTSEVAVLHFPTDSRQVRSMDRDELFAIYKKYRFIPSPSDKEEAEKQIQLMLKCINELVIVDDLEEIDDDDFYRDIDDDEEEGAVG